MTTDMPEPLYQSKAAVLMSQPLKSSPASMLSSRYRAWAPSPPSRNSTRMSRPIDDDGTLSCSIGTFEKAAAGRRATDDSVKARQQRGAECHDG